MDYSGPSISVHIFVYLLTYALIAINSNEHYQIMDYILHHFYILQIITTYFHFLPYFKFYL